MAKNRLLFFGLILVLGVSLLTISCAFIIVPYPQARAPWSSRLFYDRTFPLESGGRVEFLAEASEVSLEIKGQEKEELRLTASQSLPFSARGAIVLGPGRSQPRIETEIRESSLLIRVEERKETGFPIKVDLQVPRKVELNPIRIINGEVIVRDLFGSLVVHLEGGKLKINNFSGSVDASVETGDIEAEILDLREEDELNLRTMEGNILLSLESQAEATIEAKAVDGHIASDFPSGPETGNHLVFRLGEGKARIFLTTLHGDIRIKRIE